MCPNEEGTADTDSLTGCHGRGATARTVFLTPESLPVINAFNQQHCSPLARAPLLPLPLTTAHLSRPPPCRDSHTEEKVVHRYKLAPYNFSTCSQSFSLSLSLAVEFAKQAARQTAKIHGCRQGWAVASSQPAVSLSNSFLHRSPSYSLQLNCLSLIHPS